MIMINVCVTKAHKKHKITGSYKAMKKHDFQKLEAITPATLIVGVDIAKNVHWARFTDYRGLPLGKGN